MGLLQTSCSNFGVTVLVLIREGCTQRIHFLLSTEGFYLQVFLVLHSRKKKKSLGGNCTLHLAGKGEIHMILIKA